MKALKKITKFAFNQQIKEASMKLIIWLIAAFIISCSSSGEEVNNSSSSYYISSSSSSDRITYGTCRGIRYNSGTMGCCGVSIYLLETQGCDQGEFVKEKCDNGVDLCFQPTLDTYAKCGDVYYGKTQLGCCGNEVYILSSHFCTGTSYPSVVPKCGGKTYDYYNQDCCGNTVYDIKTSSGIIQACDNGRVHSLCGSTYYDNITQGCCGSNLFTRSEQRCGSGNVIEDKCGTIYYKPSTQGCCGNKIFTLSSERCDFDDIIEIQCGDDYYNPLTQFCSPEDNKVYTQCGGKSYNLSTQGCCGNNTFELSNQRCNSRNVVETQCGGDYYNSLTQFCFYKDNKIYNKCGDSEYAADASISCSNGRLFFNYGSLDYGGYTYKTIEIGSQIWMAENLKYNNTSSYSWATAMTICPSGWHLPSDPEWVILVIFLGSEPGAKLNDYGFGTGSPWWTATVDNSSTGYHFYRQVVNSSLSRMGIDDSRQWGVRCLQN